MKTIDDEALFAAVFTVGACLMLAAIIVLAVVVLT